MFVSGSHQAPFVISLTANQFLVILFFLYKFCCIIPTMSTVHHHIPLPHPAPGNPPATWKKIDIVPAIGYYISAISFGGSRVSEESVGTDIVRFVRDASAPFWARRPRKPSSFGRVLSHPFLLLFVTLIQFNFIILYIFYILVRQFWCSFLQFSVGGWPGSEESVCY